jgi:hypothetical protein
VEKTWGVSITEAERIELERIITDGDRDCALEFLSRVVYEKVKSSEKCKGCLHDTERPVDEISRPIRKHKGLGSFR